MKLIFLALLIAVSGCSSKGFNKGRLRQDLASAETRQVSDEEIKKVLDLKPQLPKPFKVGIYFVENDLRRWDLRWNSEDKENILRLQDELKKTGEVSEVFLINEGVVQGRDLKSIRLAAAHHGADAVLLISAAHQTDKYTNDWALTYLLILPALFVPGTVTDTLFITRAALWDVRNEYLYMAVESESFKRKTASAINSDETKLLVKAKRESMEGLKKEILRMASEMSKN